MFTKRNILYCIIALLSMVSAECTNSSSGRQQQTLPDEEPEFSMLPGEGKPLFDDHSLKGWEIIRYGGEGEPFMKKGVLTLPMATAGMLTGVRYIGDSLPTYNYVITLEARRMEGNDFFVGLTFPYRDSFATLILGGWAGSACGLSSIDGRDASENETSRFIHFKDKQWYPVRLRVTADSIRAIVDTIRLVDIACAGKEIHLRSGTYGSTPLGLSTYVTTGEIRNMRLKRIDPE